MTDEQRVRVKMLQAEVLLATENYEVAERIVHELLTQYPKLADKARTTLLLGQTKMHVPEKADEGLLILKKVVADYGSTPSAVTAQYELAVFNLDQDINAAHIRDLSTWISDNPGHSLVEKGLERLVQAYLALTRQQVVPTTFMKLKQRE